MKTFKKLLLALGIAPLLFLATAPVYAVNLNSQLCSEAAKKGQGTPAVCGDNETNSNSNPIVGPKGVLTHVTQIFAIVLGIAAVIVIMVAGLRFITSGGDSSNVASAKRAVTYAVVGLVVAALAQSIVSFVLTRI
jgi:hypothetical protein